MNCTLVSLHSQYIHSSTVPYCLQAGIRRWGDERIRVQITEGTVNEQVAVVAERILDTQPQVVGIACYIWNIAFVWELTRTLKVTSEPPLIILGGPEVSYYAEKYLDAHPEIDYILSGEGEESLPGLLNAVLRGDDVKKVPGVCLRGHISEPVIGTGTPVKPDPAEYAAALHGRIAYWETSRGCPYSCAFCLSGRCGSVRFYDPEESKRELIALAQHGARTIKLVDRTFNANPARARDFWAYLIDQSRAGVIPAGICYHFEIAGDILDEESIRILGSAPVGLFQLEIGMQSFHEPTLSAIHRKTNTTRLRENIRRLLIPGNMHIHIDLIAGLPLEDLDTFADSFRIGWKLGAHMLQLGFLKLLHGADMRECPEEYPCTFRETPPYEVTSTPWLTEADLAVIHDVEDSLDRLVNSGRFRRTVAYLTDTLANDPWELLRTFGASVRDAGRMPLEEYMECFFRFCTENPRWGADARILRDCMVCDRLATNQSGFIPAFLKREDRQLRVVRNDLERTRPQNVRRVCALLYGAEYADAHHITAVWADYTVPNPITHEYELHFMKVSR